jgi:hypothetical protein
MQTAIDDEADVTEAWQTRPNDLSFDEALSAAVIGFRVTCDLLPKGSYIHYEFNGWRHEFSHNGRIGSSSAWTFDDTHKAARWRTFELREPKRDSWGRIVDAE